MTVISLCWIFFIVLFFGGGAHTTASVKPNVRWSQRLATTVGKARFDYRGQKNLCHFAFRFERSQRGGGIGAELLVSHPVGVGGMIGSSTREL